MARGSVTYADLIARPWKRGSSNPSTGLDCWGVVEVVYARSGVSVPSLTAEITARDREACRVDGAFVDDVVLRNRFRPIDWPREELRELDVVTSLDRKGRVHVGVVVDAHRRLVLSANPSIGVYTCRVDRIRGFDGIYRMAW